RLLTQAVQMRRAWLTAQENSLPARGFLAQATLELADVCGRQGDVKAMHEGFKKGIKLVHEILERKEFHDFRADLAESSLMYGIACLRVGDDAEARAQFAKCPALIAIALERAPDSLRYQSLMVRTHYSLGLMGLKAGDKSAAQHFADALQIQERL